MQKGPAAKTAQKGRHMAAAKKDVALAEEKDNLPVAYDYGDDAGAGFEGTSRDDFTMPFLYILQSNSPIVEQGLVDAARPGVLMNSATQEMYPADQAKPDHTGLAFIPCHRQHIFVEWKPNRGGFVAQHEVDSAEVARAKKEFAFGKLKIGENDLIETFYVFGLMVKVGGEFEPIVVPFSSTKIKLYKQTMTRLNSIRVNGKQPPLWAHRLRLRTAREENDKGAFFNFRVDFDGNNAVEARLDPASTLFAEARAFWENCRSGIAKPNYESADAATEGTVASGDEDLPF